MQAVLLARRLEAWGAERDWRGTDPYDGLNTDRRFLGPVKRTALGRRLLIQAVKRSPVDLRPLLGITPAVSAASIAWVASAYAKGGFLQPEQEQAKLVDSLQRLDGLRSPGFGEPCWGYHFDFQSRVVHYRRGEPNTIATAFAGIALLDAHQRLGEPALLEEAVGVARFFRRWVGQTPSGEGAYFGYHPGDRSPIHNSNLLASAVLARVSAATGDGDMANAAAAGLRFTLAHQRSDGSWPYGERPDLSWVDNFHTGYLLDSLRACIDAGIGGIDAQNAWRRGVAFYRRNLFLADGTPKYLASRVHPVDALCVAQGMQTLSIAVLHDPTAAITPWRIFEFTRRRMLRRDGLPIFQRRRLWANRALHMRWAIAPLLLALTYLIQLEDRQEPSSAVALEEAMT